MELKLNCLALMTIVTFGGKRGKLSKPQKTISAVKYRRCGSVLLQEGLVHTQNRWHHEEGTLCRNIEETSYDIGQEVKAWAQTVLPNGQ